MYRKDKWFDFDLTAGGSVLLQEQQFQRQGEIQNWLTSEAFDLKSAYPTAAEKVIEKAAALMKCEAPDAETIQKTHKALHAVLSETDPLWLRWKYIAEKKGWQL